MATAPRFEKDGRLAGVEVDLDLVNTRFGGQRFFDRPLAVVAVQALDADDDQLILG